MSAWRTALLANLAGVLAIGWLAVWSASALGGGVAHKQAAHIAMGLLLLLWGSRRNLEQLSPWVVGAVYTATLGMLVLVMLPGVGQTVNGSQRWLSMGPLGAVQPSEFAKLALVLVLARLYAPQLRVRSHESFEASPGWGILHRFVVATILTGIPFALVAKQPDLGTALVLGAIYLGISFLAMVPWWALGALLGSAGAVMPLALKEYQRNRLLIFLHPELDPKGMGYHLLQSKLTIGSGGLWGQGLGNGAMTQNGFVPENWTDFVFTVIGEELGWVGCTGLVLLVAGLCLSIACIAFGSKGRTGSLIAGGVFSMLSFQFLVNLSMTLGLAPVVGIPLPFCSYGGSALVMNMFALGLVLSQTRAPKRELLAGAVTS